MHMHNLSHRLHVSSCYANTSMTQCVKTFLLASMVKTRGYLAYNWDQARDVISIMEGHAPARVDRLGQRIYLSFAVIQAVEILADFGLLGAMLARRDS